MRLVILVLAASLLPTESLRAFKQRGSVPAGPGLNGSSRPVYSPAHR
jgi:hypothetical protein